MVGPFLEITLVPELSLRKATLTVFYDMIQCEQVSTLQFKEHLQGVLFWLGQKSLNIKLFSLHVDHFD